jgi:hypothetical protein
MSEVERGATSMTLETEEKWLWVLVGEHEKKTAGKE